MSQGFTGTLSVNVIEAVDLPPSTQLSGGKQLTCIHPYCAISVDGNYVGQTDHIRDTHSPQWNQTTEESFVQNAMVVDVSIFHHATPPPDVFICNATVSLDDLLRGGDVEVQHIVLNDFHLEKFG